MFFLSFLVQCKIAQFYRTWLVSATQLVICSPQSNHSLHLPQNQFCWPTSHLCHVELCVLQYCSILSLLFISLPPTWPRHIIIINEITIITNITTTRPSKCQKFYTSRILGEKNLRQKLRK